MKAAIRLTTSMLMASIVSLPCWVSGNIGIRPISRMLMRYIMARNTVSIVRRRGKRSRISGAKSWSILAAVPIMLAVPMKLSSALSSRSRPLQNVPPTRLAMILEV